MTDRWRCGDCGYEPKQAGRPTILTCPRCKGDFTWEPKEPMPEAHQLVVYGEVVAKREGE